MVGSLANIFICPRSLVVTVIESCKELLQNYIGNVKICQGFFCSGILTLMSINAYCSAGDDSGGGVGLVILPK